MNREDILRMAHEADEYADRVLSPGEFHPDKHDVRDLHFAALVAAAEWEKVAKENSELLQALQNLHQRCHWSDAPEEMDAAKAAIDKAIRARGEQEQR